MPEPVAAAVVEEPEKVEAVVVAPVVEVVKAVVVEEPAAVEPKAEVATAAVVVPTPPPAPKAVVAEAKLVVKDEVAPPVKKVIVVSEAPKPAPFVPKPKPKPEPAVVLSLEEQAIADVSKHSEIGNKVALSFSQICWVSLFSAVFYPDTSYPPLPNYLQVRANAEREAAQVAKRRARDEAAAEMELRKAKDAMQRQEKIAAVARAAAVAVPKSVVAAPPKVKAAEPVVVAKKDTPPPPPAAALPEKKKAAFSIFGTAKPAAEKKVVVAPAKPVLEKKCNTI
jgi:hypothetical protein